MIYDDCLPLEELGIGISWEPGRRQVSRRTAKGGRKWMNRWMGWRWFTKDLRWRKKKYKPPVIITHLILSNLIFSRYFPGQAHLIPLDTRRCGPCFGGLAKPKSQTLCRHPACWWWHLKARNPRDFINFINKKRDKKCNDNGEFTIINNTITWQLDMIQALEIHDVNRNFQHQNHQKTKVTRAEAAAAWRLLQPWWPRIWCYIPR